MKSSSQKVQPSKKLKKLNLGRGFFGILSPRNTFLAQNWKRSKNFLCHHSKMWNIKTYMFHSHPYIHKDLVSIQQT